MTVKSGSALIMVVCITSMLIVTMTTSWYIACLLHEAAGVRQRCLQCEHAIKGLLTYATHKAQTTFNTLFVAELPVTLYQGSWPAVHTTYTGKAIAYKTGITVTVSATLQEHGRIIAQARSVVARNQTDLHRVDIVEWNIHEPL